MQLQFLGTGSAFCLREGAYQSNLILTSPSGRRLLLDCGSDIRFSLRDAGLTFRDIDAIYVSHLHADHVGGLEFMGFATRFGLVEPRKPSLYISEHICDQLWDHSLCAGMGVVEKADSNLGDYFDVRRIMSGDGFTWEGIDFELVTTVHVAGSAHNFYSYGLLFEINGTSVFVTTDTKFSPERLMPYYERADLILHDSEVGNKPSSVHPHYDELLTLPEHVRAKTWLYGYGDDALPDARADGFRGFAVTRQTFDFAAAEA